MSVSHVGATILPIAVSKIWWNYVSLNMELSFFRKSFKTSRIKCLLLCNEWALDTCLHSIQLVLDHTVFNWFVMRNTCVT